MEASRRLRRRPGSSRSDERGIAIVVVLLILMVLTVGTLGIFVAAQRELITTSREITRQKSTVGADAGVRSGEMWFRTQGFLAPPERVNEANITDPTEPGYWNVRNYGGIADSDASTASNWQAVAPDMVLPQPPAPPVDPQHRTRVWYQVQTRPGATVFSNRVRGEEAGRSARFSYALLSRAESADGGTVTLEETLAQTYRLSFYD